MIKFIDHFIGGIFKILPLKETNNIGLHDYIDSVIMQAYGATKRYNTLCSSEYFSEIINALIYMRDNNFTVKQCKREVFKCINLLEKIKKDG